MSTTERRQEDAQRVAAASGAIRVERLDELEEPTVEVELPDPQHMTVDHRTGHWIVETPDGGLTAFVRGDAAGLHAPNVPVRAERWIAGCSADRTRLLVAAHDGVLEWTVAADRARVVIPARAIDGEIEAIGYIDDARFFIYAGGCLSAWPLDAEEMETPSAVWTCALPGLRGLSSPFAGIAALHREEPFQTLLCVVSSEGLHPIGRIDGFVQELWVDDIADGSRCFASIGPHGRERWEIHHLDEARPEGPAMRALDVLLGADAPVLRA